MEKTVKDETVKDETVKDETVKDETVKDETVKDEYVIKTEPRMVREDFQPRLPSWMPKPTAMDNLILLITLPKGSSYEDANYSSNSLYDDIIHYVTIGNNDYTEVEVLSKPPNKMSILWGLFKWTYR